MLRYPSEPDEGYIGGSEETRNASESDTSLQDDTMEDATERVVIGKSKIQTLLDEASKEDVGLLLEVLVNALDRDKDISSLERLVFHAVAALPTSSVAALVDQVHHRLHVDPVLKLPTEITAMIFHSLEPDDLLHCSRMSKTWRQRVRDRNLWKTMFSREGWVTDPKQVQKDIDRDNARRSGSRPARRKLQGDNEANSSRKRQQRTSIDSVTRESEVRAWSEQHGSVEADGEQAMEGVEQMDTLADVQALSPFGMGGDDDTAHHPSFDEDALREQHIREGVHLPVKSKSLEQTRPSRGSDWLWLYKQRRRLEANWNNARYTTFQLPRYDHREDAHDECVYTIQYNSDYLVSGSRDKTIKIWNLKTERCERTLRGQHDQSVLCLQFDQDQDIIVSGGSDSYVIIWKFSDGRVIRKLTDAHDESVLNLRFDDRFLVTCSKDKLIKLWNRHEIFSDDPIIPTFVLPRFQGLARPIKEYSLIATLEGHNAAVNAVQILGNHIVSASGDRSIILWDINEGRKIREFSGHAKGIACVQYDGRRIISGSSDNTVRIFDAQTGAEVACLSQHSALVRTLQARFGDMAESPEELESQAAAIDRRWQEARARGEIPDRVARGTARNAGSSDPRDICATGAKIPPGGGGNRWSRIVSGSYDETVIIWKKDHQGRWACSRRLWQSEIFNDDRNQGRNRGPRVPGAGHAAPGQNTAQGQAPQQGQAIQQTAHQIASALTAQMGQLQANVQATAAQLQAMNPTPAAAAAPVPHPAAQNQILPNAQPPMINTLIGPHHHQMMAQRARGDDSNRVFKLQFDSRRIVCCSQNRMIVGWDFANADPELEEASRYFMETE
ncbi:hypothetical protein MBLNU457_6781t1 [Dothideomycetes sp. NU457]